MPTGVTGFTTRNVPYFDDTLQAANIGDGIVALTTWINLHPGVSVETTTSRNALAGADLWDGRIIWNQTTLQLEKYDTGSATWKVAAPTTGLATTVVGPDNNNASASVGTSGLAARADHDHGTPAIVGGNLPTTQAFGDAASAGTALLAARRDHLHGMPAAPAQAVTQIANSVLGSAAASVTFSSIPGTYNRLELSMVAACSAAIVWTEILAQFNSDTAGNYGQYQMNVSNSSVLGSNNTGDASVYAGLVYGTGGPINGAGSSVMVIGGYAGTTFSKQVTTQASAISFGSASNSIAGQYGGAWNSTAAITSIKLTVSGGSNFITGSSFYLYGIT